MGDKRKLQFGSLESTLENVPYSLTVSDLAQEDAPLIFMNKAFRTMTGCTAADLGRNCRFLQGDLENDQARAEIRVALEEERRTQVVLRNKRANGEVFHNLLLLEPIANGTAPDRLVLGVQFELSDEEHEDLTANDATDVSAYLRTAKNDALRLRLERRRIAATSSVQLFQSWLTLNRLST